MYVLVYYVPEEALELTKKAIFKAGAGSIGSYSECCWQIKGEGQFLPGSSANPYSGKKGVLSRVMEYRVEIALADNLKDHIIAVLKKAHPYEVPAYHLLKVDV